MNTELATPNRPDTSEMCKTARGNKQAKHTYQQLVCHNKLFVQVVQQCSWNEKISKGSGDSLWTRKSMKIRDYKQGELNIYVRKTFAEECRKNKKKNDTQDTDDRQQEVFPS